MIYLDNASTTRVWDRAIKKTEEIYSVGFFNPSSTYGGGMTAASEIKAARATVAKRLNCAENEVYFTSCATEANNWAINGIFSGKGNIVVGGGEHACVYECAKSLKSKGFDVRFSKLLPSLEADEDDLLSLVDENTRLVSVIHASNETGTVNDVARLSRLVKQKNKSVVFHSDGVQAYLKISNDVKSLGVDLYSISGHKVGAPKGVGALYAAKSVRLKPFIYGGGQESGMRSGTENVAGIAALGVATEEYSARFDGARALKLRQTLVSALAKAIPSIVFLGEGAKTNGVIVAFSALGTRAEIIQSLCADQGVMIGRGSACSSRRGGNRVLEAAGFDKKVVDGALRLSLSPETTEEEILTAVKVVAKNVENLRGGRLG